MRTIKADLSENIKELELHVFSDWHVGDVSCNIKEIEAEIQSVKENPNAFVICNGDLMNNATKTSVSDCYAEEFTPMKQVEKLVSLLDPISKKIIMITNGNHEARTYRADGIDLMSMVAVQIGASTKYCREGGVVFLRFGKNDKQRKSCYTIYATHGSGGGRKEGAKAIRLADMASIIDCDIYIHSHTHLPMVIKEGFFRLDTCNSAVAKVDKLFVNTAAKLGYGGYGQTYEFKPASTANPIIYLNGHKKEFSARL